MYMVENKKNMQIYFSKMAANMATENLNLM